MPLHGMCAIKAFGPWRDMGDKPASVTDKITANGITYYLPMVMLAPHETQAIDISKLLQSDKKDPEGTKMPSGATDGTIVWDRMNEVPVAGRVVVIKRKAGLASNFDCCVCMCGVSYAQLSLSPIGMTCVIGQSFGLVATARYSDRCGDQFYCTVTSLCSWGTSNSSICTVSGGTVTGAGSGTGTITATYSDYVWTYDSQNNTCNATLTPHSGTSSITVDTLVFSITSGGVTNDPNGVVAKQQFNLKMQAKSPSGTVPDTTFNSSNVPFTLTNENTSAGEAAPSSVNFSSGTANASVTIVQASGLTNSTRTIVVSANATGTVFYPYDYMNVTATDEGLVGHVTACNYTIPTNAQMVALPYSTALCGDQVLVANGSAHQQVPVEDVGPWCPNTPGPGNSNTCSCSADNYWQGTAVPYAATHSCSSNGAGIDLGDGTYSTVRGGTNGPVDWKFP